MTEPLPCILYNKHLNITLKYKCNFEEICCDHEDGCCPIHPVKYYESWYFWVFVLVILVSSYLLCWYCKKLEKRRQRITEQGRTGILPFVRTINEDNIDQLLETFALHYGIQFAKQDQQEAPPKYLDALKMPKVTTSVQPESIILNIDNEFVPSYEEAIKNS